jgi:hypothetical protein
MTHIKGLPTSNSQEMTHILKGLGGSKKLSAPPKNCHSNDSASLRLENTYESGFYSSMGEHLYLMGNNLGFLFLDVNSTILTYNINCFGPPRMI